MTDEIEVQGADDESVDQPFTLRDELESAFKESKEKELPQNTETDIAKAQRSRNEDGKFAKKVEPAEIKEVVDPAQQATTEQVKQVIAPKSWTAASKARWTELPADIQAEISKREEEVEKGFTRFDEERNFGKSLKEVITPYMPMITGEGGNPVAAVQSLLNTAYQLRTGTAQQKGELIQQLAKQFGADMSQVNSPATYVDPQVQTLQQRLDYIEQQRQQEINQQKSQYQESLRSEINAFASDPANIHFDKVEAHMAALLQGGVVTNLKDAYDQAVYARPDIRSTLLEQQRADSEAKRLADSKAKTQAARNASSSVTGAPGISVSNKGNPERNLRDEIRANLNAAIH